MGLVLKNKICLNTQLGACQIQLMFGDITQLPLEEKVDIVFVSAFPGDYTPVPRTMMGALRRNLDIDMDAVARDKATDLRSSFNCWVSKPLPQHLPFDRIVCFERMNRFEKFAEQISGMFRAMMPVFNNQETTVITPLLASGDQGHSEMRVLRSIVTAACHWMKAGLPLRCLKIVVYTSNPHVTSQSGQELLEVFQNLKTKWEEKQTAEVTKVEKTIDVCLSFSQEDKGYVEAICGDLRRLHPNLVIHSEEFVYNHDNVWQEKIFSVMVSSRKIVAVLTPQYLENTECLEQYNLALCCNRLTGSEVLAPFYLQTVPTFPAYMTLIQYTECRVRNKGEKSEEKIYTACVMLVKEMDRDTVPQVPSQPSQTSQATLPSKPAFDRLISTSSTSSTSVYDVFISYAHKTPKEAQKFYQNLLDIDENLKVFLDRSELRTGNMWQEALYEAADTAKVFVAFISENYITSTVCQEEYNIALARYLSSEGVYLLPLLTSPDMKELPGMFSSGPVVDVSGMVLEEQHFMLAQTVVNWVKALKAGQPVLNRFRLVDPRNKTRIIYTTVHWRERDFNRRFTFKKDSSVIQLRNPKHKPSENGGEKKPADTENPDLKCSQNPDQKNSTTENPEPKNPTPTAENPELQNPTPTTDKTTPADQSNTTTTIGRQKKVVLSFAQDCFKQAKVLACLLEQRGEGGGEKREKEVQCEFLSSLEGDGEGGGGGVVAPKLQLLDSADMVVVIVSDDYLESAQHRHELHISLCRQRVNQEQRVVYLIEAHQSIKERTYSRLLHYSVSLGDELWPHLARKHRLDIRPVSVATDDEGVVQMHCSGGEYLALYAASLDILDYLHAGKQPGGSGMPCNIVNLTCLRGPLAPDTVPMSQIAMPYTSLVEERPSHEDQALNPERHPGLTRKFTQEVRPSLAAKPRPSLHGSQSCLIL